VNGDNVDMLANTGATVKGSGGQIAMFGSTTFHYPKRVRGMKYCIIKKSKSAIQRGNPVERYTWLNHVVKLVRRHFRWRSISTARLANDCLS
jgi:hypothetical protein